MKKVVAGLFACAVVLCGICTFAAESEQDVYFGSDNSVHIGDYNDVDGKEYTTVLIRKAGTTDASGVVYVDQQSGGFDSVMNFMLKAGTAEGDYVATFGNSRNETKTVGFTVGDITATAGSKTITLDHANKMTVIDEAASTANETFTRDPKDGNAYYKKGFTFLGTLNQFNSFDRIYLVSANGEKCVGAFDLYTTAGEHIKPEYSGEGAVAFGIQIYNLREENKGINLYLGTEGGTK